MRQLIILIDLNHFSHFIDQEKLRSLIDTAKLNVVRHHTTLTQLSSVLPNLGEGRYRASVAFRNEIKDS